MARNKVKSISTSPVKFIPTTHASDKSLDENAADIINRPLVFMVKKMSRDDHFKVRELLEFKDDLKPEKGLRGAGDVAKFIWENNILEVRNVVIQENGATITHEFATDAVKNSLWDTEGMDAEINEAIIFAREASILSEPEVKN